MSLLFLGRKKQQTSEQAIAAQTSDAAREELLLTFRPWLLRVAARACKRYITDHDDEYSIALMALNESIDKYKDTGGASFTTFAEMVIRKRLIDHRRKQKFQQLMVPGGLANDLYSHTASLDADRCSREIADRQEEIERINGQLAPFGIVFADLVKQSPRHRDARETAMGVARLVATNQAFLGSLLRTKSLPLKELEQAAAVSRKTLERQRKYIITLVLILACDYPLLRSFIQWPREEP